MRRHLKHECLKVYGPHYGTQNGSKTALRGAKKGRGFPQRVGVILPTYSLKKKCLLIIESNETREDLNVAVASTLSENCIN